MNNKLPDGIKTKFHDFCSECPHRSIILSDDYEGEIMLIDRRYPNIKNKISKTVITCNYYDLCSYLYDHIKQKEAVNHEQ